MNLDIDENCRNRNLIFYTIYKVLMGINCEVPFQFFGNISMFFYYLSYKNCFQFWFYVSVCVNISCVTRGLKQYTESVSTFFLSLVETFGSKTFHFFKYVLFFFLTLKYSNSFLVFLLNFCCLVEYFQLFKTVPCMRDNVKIFTLKYSIIFHKYCY